MPEECGSYYLLFCVVGRKCYVVFVCFDPRYRREL